MQYVRLLPSSVVLCLYFVRRSLQVQGQAYHDEGNNGLTLCEQHSQAYDHLMFPLISSVLLWIFLCNLLDLLLLKVYVLKYGMICCFSNL
jgi:hypothetical protein